MAEMGTEQQVPAESGQGVPAEQEAATPAAAEGQAAESATSEEGAEIEAKKAEIKAAEKQDLTDPGVKRELGKLRREVRELREKAARQEGFIEGMKASKSPDTAITEPEAEAYPIPRPVQKEDEPYEDFTVRLSKWAYAEEKWKDEQQGKTSKVSEAKKAIVEKGQAQREAGNSKYDDFEDVVQTLPPLPNDLIEEMYDSEVGHDIAYHFGTNPKELQRILTLSPSKRMREFARLEDQMKAGAVVKTKTAAPEPPPTVRAAGNASADALYMSDKISAAERIRMSQERKMAAFRGK